jgi:hypothetical protein
MWFKRKQRNRRLGRGHVLDVKLRSEQVRATRTRLALMAISVPTFTLFALYLLWRTGEWTLDKFVYENAEFAIQRVEVQTDGRETRRKFDCARFGVGETQPRILAGD